MFSQQPKDYLSPGGGTYDNWKVLREEKEEVGVSLTVDGPVTLPPIDHLANWIYLWPNR